MATATIAAVVALRLLTQRVGPLGSHVAIVGGGGEAPLAQAVDPVALADRFPDLCGLTADRTPDALLIAAGVLGMARALLASGAAVQA